MARVFEKVAVVRSATYRRDGRLEACSACAGEYEDPERTAEAVEEEVVTSEDAAEPEDECRSSDLMREARWREGVAEAETR